MDVALYPSGLTSEQWYKYATQENRKHASQEWISGLVLTHYFCPECLIRGDHKYLRIQNNGKYFCTTCKEEFVATDIIESYEGSIDSWRSDADWLEDRCKMLKEGNRKGI